jgi:ABC-2 type transport system permease protein
MRAFFARLRAIAHKETLHMLREPRTLVVVFLQPVMLMILYGYCMSFDAKHVPFAVWDQDRTEQSRRLLTRLKAAGGGETFTFVGGIHDPRQIEPTLASGAARFVLVIPQGLARDVAAGRRVALQALFDAADSNTANLASGYVSQAIAAESSDLALEFVARRHGAAVLAQGRTPAIGGGRESALPLSLDWRVLYNPDLSSRRFIVPGLIAILLTTVAASLTSTTIVRERELGPIESLLTAPVGAVELVLGKLAPYIVLAAGNVALVLLAGGIVFGVWPRGSVIDLVSFSFLFTLGMLSMGMLISSRVQNQNQALLAATIGTLLPNVFLTGFAFPRSNMPDFLQWVSMPLPATQYIAAIRGIFLKGAGWSVYWPQGLWMTLVCVLLLAVAIRRVDRMLVRGLD